MADISGKHRMNFKILTLISFFFVFAFVLTTAGQFLIAVVESITCVASW